MIQAEFKYRGRTLSVMGDICEPDEHAYYPASFGIDVDTVEIFSQRIDGKKFASHELYEACIEQALEALEEEVRRLDEL